MSDSFLPHQALFQPLDIKSLHLPNRIVMAPMTRSFSPAGIPTDEVAAYYRRRAEAEVGLIITEGTAVQRASARNDAAVPDFHGEALPAWGRVVKEVHDVGGRIAPQLWHVGAVRSKGETLAPEEIDSPSGLYKPERPVAPPMTDEAVADTIEAFARAAADAIELGFDSIELHGAHGYLIDQFFWEGTNQRSDRWGGAGLTERSRFATELVRAVRARMPEEVPLILRLSQWKQQDYAARLAPTPAALEQWLQPLAEAGVDVFHCSQRRFWEPEFEGSPLNFAGWTKKITGKVTITVGSVGLEGDFFGAFQGKSSTPARLDELITRLEAGEFDLVAVGRALISDAEWTRKVRTGRMDALKGFARDDLARLD